MKFAHGILLTVLLGLFTTALAVAKPVMLDVKTSRIEWLGQKKLPGGDHKGWVKIKKGEVNMDEQMMVSGGNLVIDMSSIVNQDLSGKLKKKLESHLNSEDFFHVKKYPEANFQITKVKKQKGSLYEVTGKLTIRDKTQSETFSMRAEKQGAIMVFKGDIVIDRTKYGVTYNSETKGLKKAVKLAKDKIIKDQIKLKVDIRTQKI